MAQPVKAATTRPKDLNPIPRTQVVERKLVSTGCPLITDHEHTCMDIKETGKREGREEDGECKKGRGGKPA